MKWERQEQWDHQRRSKEEAPTAVGTKAQTAEEQRAASTPQLLTRPTLETETAPNRHLQTNPSQVGKVQGRLPEAPKPKFTVDSPTAMGLLPPRPQNHHQEQRREQQVNKKIHTNQDKADHSQKAEYPGQHLEMLVLSLVAKKR